MFKSIFAKYYSIMLVIILGSFICVGVFQLYLSSRYWAKDKKEMLSESTRNIISYVSREDIFEIEMGEYGAVIEKLQPLVNMVGKTVGGQIFLVSDFGVVVAETESSLESHVGRKFPDGILEQTLATETTSFAGSLDDFFGEMNYVVGAKLGENAGFIFSVAPASGMIENTAMNVQVYLMSSAGVILVAFMAVYVMTFRMVRPLKEMAAATRRFAKGDFGFKIPVRGNDEVAELAQALNAMAVSLSSVEAVRRDFIGNVSHELRTPMTTISGFIDGILDGTIPKEKNKHYLTIVSEETKRLSRLVQGMLNISRINYGEITINETEFDLTDLVCRTLLSFEKRVEEKNVEIDGIEHCNAISVSADYGLIQQVLYNLIDNAVKFVGEGGSITIRTYVSNGRAYCVVRNTGEGLCESEMPHIFERFYKSDTSRSQNKNGVGIGLYLSKTIIDLHQGEIVVRSTMGEFCEFEFWLPSLIN